MTTVAGRCSPEFRPALDRNPQRGLEHSGAGSVRNGGGERTGLAMAVEEVGMAGKTDVEGYVQAPAFRLGGEQTPTRRRCAAEGASVLLEPGVREVLKKIRSKHSRHSGSRNDHGSGENPGPAFGSFFPPEGIDIVAARASFRAGREFFSAVGAGDTVSEFSHSTSLLLENLRLPALDAVHEVRIHAQYESKRATEKTARSVRIARIRFSREKGQKDCPLDTRLIRFFQS